MASSAAPGKSAGAIGLNGHADHSRVTAASLLIALGIVYGDIGTSPLYAMKGIAGGDVLSETLVYGGVSAVFWTLTLLTSIKYIIVTLRADNKGEGGIFSLYALVRRYRKWLFIPAILGGGFLLADGIITPPISISSAIEGLQVLNADIPTIPIVVAILVGLFLMQQFGTQSVGGVFGPVMLIWFSMIAVLGVAQIMQNPGIFRALSPHYAYQMIVATPGGFWKMGAVFLCATGAEALYSDMGHAGRPNIRISWIYVKIALVLNYLGQGAWMLNHLGAELKGQNPFFTIVPEWFYIPSVIIAATAAVVASQALISGTFTLINEAIRLNFWPRMRVRYPSDLKGQLYIPGINWAMLAGCIFIVLYFEKSEKMEAAYGLAVTCTMISTTVLLTYYLLARWSKPLVWALIVPFVLIEGSFLVTNLAKVAHGGYVSLLVAFGLILIMFVWREGRKIKDRYVDATPLAPYFPVLQELSDDTSIPKFSTHLVYLTPSKDPSKVERRILHSILNRQPKRADVYWFVHVEVEDEPYTMAYKVHKLLGNTIIFIQFRLGFRIEPRINLYFRKVIESMVARGEVDIVSRYESLGRHGIVGDFHFVLMDSYLSRDNQLRWQDKLIMDGYFLLKHLSIPDNKAYGLDLSAVTNEKHPLLISPPKSVQLTREPDPTDDQQGESPKAAATDSDYPVFSGS
jgi:KUP system potassium uptake protein